MDKCVLYNNKSSQEVHFFLKRLIINIIHFISFMVGLLKQDFNHVLIYLFSFLVALLFTSWWKVHFNDFISKPLSVEPLKRWVSKKKQDTQRSNKHDFNLL